MHAPCAEGNHGGACMVITRCRPSQQEFPARSRGYYERALADGRLRVEGGRGAQNRGDPTAPLHQGQTMRHFIHRHEPPVLDLPIPVRTHAAWTISYSAGTHAPPAAGCGLQMGRGDRTHPSRGLLGAGAASVGGRGGLQARHSTVHAGGFARGRSKALPIRGCVLGFSRCWASRGTWWRWASRRRCRCMCRGSTGRTRCWESCRQSARTSAPCCPCTAWVRAHHITQCDRCVTVGW